MSYYVCDELIDNIFKKLPTKSLLRFRCLSKSWCSRIGSSDFIGTHVGQNLQKVLIKHLTSSKEFGIEYFYTIHSEDQLPLTHKHGYMGIGSFPCNDIDCSIVGSCNGLLCVFSHKIGMITLWNPSIRRKLTLPHPPCGTTLLKNTSPKGLVSTRTTVTDDYKIVRISYSIFERAPSRSMVYTTNTGTWRTIASPVTQISEVTCCGCFVNGALHWIVREYDMRYCYIMSFDLSTEVFGRVLLLEPSLRSRELIVINGSLAVTTGDRHNLTIWAMREEDNVASRSMFFKLEALPSEEGILRVLPLTTNGDLLFKTDREGYKVYNLATGIRSRLVNFNAQTEQLQIERYVESLVLLNKGTDCNGNQQSWLQPKKRK